MLKPRRKGCKNISVIQALIVSMLLGNYSYKSISEITGINYQAIKKICGLKTRSARIAKEYINQISSSLHKSQGYVRKPRY